LEDYMATEEAQRTPNEENEISALQRRVEVLERNHRKTSWVIVGLVGLAVWQFAGPHTGRYQLFADGYEHYLIHRLDTATGDLEAFTVYGRRYVSVCRTPAVSKPEEAAPAPAPVPGPPAK
jgi:hypothetical protein